MTKKNIASTLVILSTVFDSPTFFAAVHFERATSVAAIA